MQLTADKKDTIRANPRLDDECFFHHDAQGATSRRYALGVELVSKERLI